MGSVPKLGGSIKGGIGKVVARRLRTVHIVLYDTKAQDIRIYI